MLPGWTFGDTDRKEETLDLQMLVDGPDRRQHRFLVALSFEHQGGESRRE